MTTLDDIKQIKKLDKSGLANFIADLPEQCLKAEQQSQKIILSKNYQNTEKIVICGMGGSAIGGELIKDLTADQLKIPVIVNRDWNLPALVDQNTLVILVSYSGQTQETLSCAKKAIKKKAKIFIITGGGELAKLAKKEKISVLKFNYQAPPRASLGYLFIPILVILEKLKFISLKSWSIKSSLGQLKKFSQAFDLEVPTEKNIAKYLAYFVFDHLPIIIAPTKMTGVARRWKTQMAENSKNFAFFEISPEILHNSIESQFPWRLKDELVFLILEESKGKRESRKALKTFQKLLDKQNIRWESVPTFGTNLFIQTLSSVIMGDWLSFYLSMLNQTDPTPVNNINWLKKRLKK